MTQCQGYSSDFIENVDLLNSDSTLDYTSPGLVRIDSLEKTHFF